MHDDEIQNGKIVFILFLINGRNINIFIQLPYSEMKRYY